MTIYYCQTKVKTMMSQEKKMEYALSLTEYSTKYDVSVSTLRRKIKKSAILNKMIEGKYFLPDLEYRKLSQQNTPPHKSKVDTAPPQELESKKPVVKEYEGEDLEPLLEVKFVEKVESSPPVKVEKKEEESVSELKEAFRMVLSEKENQITTLKSYIADLQTLNRVLESELERLEQLDKKTKSSFYEIEFE